MTQPLATDFPIDPVTTSGTALADILNRFSDSVNTSNSGATPPPDTTPGMLWLDTSGAGNGVLRMRNAANTAWIQIADTSGAVKLADGTMAAPGLAWASETGLGWYRIGASKLGFAAGGSQVQLLDASNAASTILAYYPRAAGTFGMYVGNKPVGTANAQDGEFLLAADGTLNIRTGASGSAARGNIVIDGPRIDLSAPDLRIVGITNTPVTPNLYRDTTNGYIYTNSSSARYKKNIETLEDSSFLYDLRPVTFNSTCKGFEEGRYVGFIAEEVAEVAPAFVDYADGVPEGVRYAMLVSPIVNELKKLRQRVAQLEHA